MCFVPMILQPSLLRNLVSDLSFGLRRYRRRPGMLLLILITIAVAVGGTTVVFVAVNEVLYRPLPFPDPDQLIMIRRGGRLLEGSAGDRRLTNIRTVKAFQDVAMYRDGDVNVEIAGQAYRVRAAEISSSFVGTLRIRFVAGPGIIEGSRYQVGFVSHRFWRQTLGAEPHVDKLALSVNGRPIQIRGVVAPEHRLPAGVDIWIPLGAAGPIFSRGAIFYHILARLDPNYNLAQAQAMLEVLSDRISRARLGGRTSSSRLPVAIPLKEYLSASSRTRILALFMASCVLFLIAMVNTANLFLIDSSERLDEFSMRVALGATFPNVVRQLLCEALLLTLLGGGAGLGVAVLLLDVTKSIIPIGSFFQSLVEFDTTTVAFAICLALMVSASCAVLSAFHIRRALLSASDAYRPTANVVLRPSRIQNALVALQVGLAVSLLTMAGLLGETYWNLMRKDLGFQPRGVVTADVDLASSKYSDPTAVISYYRLFLDRLKSLPGVQSVAAVNSLPLSGKPSIAVRISTAEGKAAPVDPVFVGYRVVTLAYFQAMGIRLLRGRDFDYVDKRIGLATGRSLHEVLQSSNVGPTPKIVNSVAVVNESFARSLWGAQDPIGRKFEYRIGEPRIVYTVIGEVNDLKHTSLREHAMPEFYVIHDEQPSAFMSVVVRCQVNCNSLPGGIRRAAKMTDASQPISLVRPMNAILRSSIQDTWLTTLYVSSFAAVALLIAGLGMFATIRSLALKRRRECALRIALGCPPARAAYELCRASLLTVCAGIALGGGLSFIGQRAIAAVFLDSTSLPLETLTAVVLLVLTVAILAAWIPTRTIRAAQPASTLKDL